MRLQRFSLILMVAVTATSAASCARKKEPPPAASADSAFAQLQERGKMAMGVDQYTSRHHFETTADGGSIALQRDTADSIGVTQIRAHLKLIQHAFQAGDFSTPAFVHMRNLPGTAVMTAKRHLITYSYSDLPRGGEVKITTHDPEALAAIRQFLDAQRMEHHAQ